LAPEILILKYNFFNSDLKFTVMQENNYPKLHNASWPGIVGKGLDAEPVIPFDTILEMTAAAEVDGKNLTG
jgi:hypothetical protein